MIVGLLKGVFLGSLYLLGTIVVVKVIITLFKSDD